MNVRRVGFPPHGDSRGQLVAIEEQKDIPFDIKRVYYIYATTEGTHRGLHAHRKLEQVLLCIHGSCKVKLDDGKSSEIVELSNPCEGIYMSAYVWRDMYDFSEDAVLLVLASDYYDEEDYIRDYDTFIELCKKRETEQC